MRGWQDGAETAARRTRERREAGVATPGERSRLVVSSHANGQLIELGPDLYVTRAFLRHASAVRAGRETATGDDAERVAAYEQIRSAVRTNGIQEVVFLSCVVGGTEEGRQLVRDLAGELGAIVTVPRAFVVSMPRPNGRVQFSMTTDDRGRHDIPGTTETDQIPGEGRSDLWFTHDPAEWNERQDSLPEERGPVVPEGGMSVPMTSPRKCLLLLFAVLSTGCGASGSTRERPRAAPTGGAVMAQTVSHVYLAFDERLFAVPFFEDEAPREILLPPPVSTVVAHGAEVCAIAASSVYCWGTSVSSQWGARGCAWHGETPRRVSERLVCGLREYGDSFCAVSDGEIHCWGSGAGGPGNTGGSGVDPCEMRAVPGATGLDCDDLSQGGFDVCWGTESGEVRCHAFTERRTRAWGSEDRVFRGTDGPVAAVLSWDDDVCAFGDVGQERGVRCCGTMSSECHFAAIRARPNQIAYGEHNTFMLMPPPTPHVELPWWPRPIDAQAYDQDDARMVWVTRDCVLRRDPWEVDCLTMHPEETPVRITIRGADGTLVVRRGP